MRTDCGSSNSRIIGLFTLATLLVSTAARPAEHSGDLSAEQDLRSRLRPFAQILADVRDRPSRVIYTEYPVSAQHGLVRGFVHVTDGTVVLARTDLVVNASLPIVIRRAYHSARSQSREFGATGWRLTLAEFIEPRRGGRFIYTYGNGATLELDSSGRIESALQAYLTDVDDIHLLSENAFQVRTRTGLSKLFRRSAGRFLLSSVTDPYGNRLDFRYQASALVRVEGSSGAWAEFEYAPHGQLKSVADSHGRSVAYEYDAAGRLAAVVDTAAQRWTFAYDSENRLRSSATPNGIVDMEFQYDARGRALSSRANGARHAFSYQKYRTAVTDPRGLTTTFAAASSGLTTEVVNALGTRTALRLARSGVPTALVRNGELAVELSTERSSGHDRPSRARVVTADGRSYLVRYDQHRRVAQVLAADGSRGFEVEQYGPGLIPQAIVHVDGTREEAQYDERGELSRLVGRDGKALSFQRTDDRWRIEDASRHHVEFQFDALGRLRSADIGKDQVLSFFYNDVGLRERTEASVGWYIRYQYDASGSLFYSSGGFKEQAGPAYNYVLRADRRLEAITDSDGDDHHFRLRRAGTAG